jgi:hypothetical protein
VIDSCKLYNAGTSLIREILKSPVGAHLREVLLYSHICMRVAVVIFMTEKKQEKKRYVKRDSLEFNYVSLLFCRSKIGSEYATFLFHSSFWLLQVF